MKSRTSFSKLTTFKKDLTRYAPLWALYAIMTLLVLLVSIDAGSYDQTAKYAMSSCVSAFGIVNMLYAVICALLLYGDLYNTRLCYALHALPQRREAWLVSHLGAGILFSLVPNLLCCGLMMFFLEAYWFIALYWLLASTLQFLFFFGLATVSAMLTGNRFAVLTVYTLLNFVATLAYGTVNTIYLPMLNGVVAQSSKFYTFSPVVKLFTINFFRFSKEKRMVQVQLMDGKTEDVLETFYVFEGLDKGWWYLAILGLVGLAAMALALVLYRKRKLEVAGDFLAFPKLKGIACLVLSACVALCFALLGEAFDSAYQLWMAVGLFIGFFGSLMLLERRIKVFRKKTFLGFAATAAVVVLSMAVIGFDLLGIESWIPRADRVESVTVSNYYRANYDYNNYSHTRLAAELTDPEDIERILQAHQDILDRSVAPSENTHTVVLTYKMKSGRVVVRKYRAPASGTNYEIVRGFLYNRENIMGFADFSQIKSIDYLYCDYGQLSETQARLLLEAIYSDCVNGSITVNTSGKGYYVDYYLTNTNGDYVTRTLLVGDGAEKTLALLKSPEFAMGYTDWDAFQSSIRSMSINNRNSVEYITAPLALLKAMEQDILAGTLRANDVSTNYVCIISYQVEEYFNGDGFVAYRDFYIPPEAGNTVAWLETNGYL